MMLGLPTLTPRPLHMRCCWRASPAQSSSTQRKRPRHSTRATGFWRVHSNYWVSRLRREELRVGFELLQRSLEALNPHDFLKSKPDLWLYFYEDFLAAYDPKLRKDFGVYYTPREVVELQVRLVSELLEQHFDKRLGFADDGVVFLDPAVGTGTYLVAAIKD